MTREINWFATQAGQALVAQAMQQAEPILWPLCGHNALLLQPVLPLLHAPALQCAPITRLWRSGNRFAGDVITDDRGLALSSDCIALVYAAFVLETSEHPLCLLQEFERLLVSEGHLALLTLNPHSLHRLTGAWRRLALKSRLQWSQCLQESGFEVIRHEALGPLWASADTASATSGFSRPHGLRSVNFTLARKRKSALTPIRKTAKAVALARESTQA
jgi:SAM-dependent methyltransferase